MSRALIFAGDKVEEAELLYPYYRLLEEGLTVDLVGAEAGKQFTGGKGYPITSNKAAKDVNVSDYDVLVVPGGFAPDKWRTDEQFVRIVREAFEQDLVVAAVCHAAQLLIEADVVRGRHITAYRAIKTDLKNAGAHFEDRDVVVDGNLVSSRGPSDLPAFMRETLRVLQARHISSGALAV